MDLAPTYEFNLWPEEDFIFFYVETDGKEHSPSSSPENRPIFVNAADSLYIRTSFCEDETNQTTGTISVKFYKVDNQEEYRKFIRIFDEELFFVGDFAFVTNEGGVKIELGDQLLSQNAIVSLSGTELELRLSVFLNTEEMRPI